MRATLARLALLAGLGGFLPGLAAAQPGIPQGGQPHQAMPVRCVNTAGTAFADCGGAGGSGGTSATDDSAFTGGATAVTPMGALYDTTPPSITDGNVGAPVMDSLRRLKIICDAGCGGASPFEDEDAFVIATTSIAVTGYVVDETTPDSAPEDSAAAPRMAPNRVPYSIVRDALGNERGASVTAANALKVDGSAVTQPISAASLPLPTGAATAANQDGIVRDGTGDTTQANVSSGRLHVDGSGVTQPVSGTVTVTDGAGNLTVDGTVTANQGGAPWSVAGPAADGVAVSGNPVRIGGKDGSGNTQDIATDTSGELQVDVLTLPANASVNLNQVAGAAVATGNGTAAGSIRVSVASDSTGQIAVASLPNEGQQTAANSISVTPDTDNDAIGATAAAPPGEAVYIGGLQSGATGGLLGGITVCDSFVNINVSTATTTLLVTGVSGRHVRFCSIRIMVAGAQTAALISGTGATCGTGTTGMGGGTSAATGFLQAAAQGGIAQGSGVGEIERTNATGDSVCLVTGSAVQTSGRLGYAIH